MNEKEYNEKMARYLGGEMDEAESASFKREIHLQSEDPAGLGVLGNRWRGLEELRDERKPDAKLAWRKLHDRLQAEQLLPVQGAAHQGFFPGWLKIAAAVVALAALAIVLYLQVIRTPEPAMVVLNTAEEPGTLIKTLEDGSVVYLAQHSQFSFPEHFEPGSRTVELKGKAFFDITPDPGKPFIITTETATIRVLGTAFQVRTHDENGFELTVERGKVSVTLKNNPSVNELVVAGEKVSATSNNLVKSQRSAYDGADWYRRQMHFKDETLANILLVLNRNFNTNFAVADNETGARRLTVTFRDESPELMTELICLTLNLKSQWIDGSVVFSENGEDPEPR